MYLAKIFNVVAILLVLIVVFPKKQGAGLVDMVSPVKAKLLQPIAERQLIRRLQRDLNYALPRMSLYEFLLICLVTCSVGLWIGLIFRNFVVALLGLGAGIYLPLRILRELVAYKQKLIDRQLEPALTQIANLYKITQSVERSFKEVSKTLVSPLKDEFLRFYADLERAGMPLEEALDRLVYRLDNKDFRFFANIAVISQKYGGETKELLHLVPQTLRERQLSRMELEAEVAGAKQQAWLLFFGTPFFLLFFYFARPDFVKILIETTMGKLGMAVVAFLCLVSIILIEKITEPVN